MKARKITIPVYTFFTVTTNEPQYGGFTMFKNRVTTYYFKNENDAKSCADAFKNAKNMASTGEALAIKDFDLRGREALYLVVPGKNYDEHIEDHKQRIEDRDSSSNKPITEINYRFNDKLKNKIEEMKESQFIISVKQESEFIQGEWGYNKHLAYEQKTSDRMFITYKIAENHNDHTRYFLINGNICHFVALTREEIEESNLQTILKNIKNKEMEQSTNYQSVSPN